MNLGHIGFNGEKTACDYLKKHRYKILTQNYWTKFGELDIVCEKDEYIIFVEVKTRSENALASGRYAVTPSKQQKMIKAALIFLSEYGENKQPRFDVIEICNGKKTSLEHIKDAFGVTGKYGLY